MKILYIALSVLFPISCPSQNFSTYIDIYNNYELNNSEQKKFVITPIRDYYYQLNHVNEKQIIAFHMNEIYKFDQLGNLIDVLELPNYLVLINIQPENNAIFLEDEYIPYWIKTGDKTKKKYDKVYNKDLAMSMDEIREIENKKLALYKYSYAVSRDEIRDSLKVMIEKTELISLFQNLNKQAKYKKEIYYSTHYASFIFTINKEVIKINIPNELRDYAYSIVGKNVIEVANPEFFEDKKPIHFMKETWVKRNWNFLSTSHGGYWLGSAYYNLVVGDKMLKIKEGSVSKGKHNKIKINRNIFPNNNYFILMETLRGKCFIKETETM